MGKSRPRCALQVEVAVDLAPVADHSDPHRAGGLIDGVDDP
jgi:hypothetical protein